MDMAMDSYHRCGRALADLAGGSETTKEAPSPEEVGLEAS